MMNVSFLLTYITIFGFMMNTLRAKRQKANLPKGIGAVAARAARVGNRDGAVIGMVRPDTEISGWNCQTL